MRRLIKSSKISAYGRRIRRADRIRINSLERKRRRFLKLYIQCVHKLKKLSLNSDEICPMITNAEDSQPFCRFDVKHWISVRYVSLISPTPSAVSIDTCLMDTSSNLSVTSAYHSDYDYGMHVCTHGIKRCLEDDDNCVDDDFIFDILSPKKKIRIQ